MGQFGRPGSNNVQRIPVSREGGHQVVTVAPSDTVAIVRAVVKHLTLNELRLIGDTADRERDRRADNDRKAREGLAESKRRKAARVRAHQERQRQADERRAERRRAHQGRVLDAAIEREAREARAARTDPTAAAYAHAYGIEL